jgi:ABC transport system ATP-binding/permease protein
MALGLLISASARSVETVFQVLVGLTLAQVVMSGGARQLGGIVGLDQISNLFPSRWAFAAGASTVNLGVIGAGLEPALRWRHTPAIWFLDMGGLTVLGTLIVFATWWLLRSGEPDSER